MTVIATAMRGQALLCDGLVMPSQNTPSWPYLHGRRSRSVPLIKHVTVIGLTSRSMHLQPEQAMTPGRWRSADSTGGAFRSTSYTMGLAGGVGADASRIFHR